MATNSEWLNSLDSDELAEWLGSEHAEPAVGHESRESYYERLHEVKVSDCPYCGCERVVIHDYSDMYDNPHSYRVEHVDEKEAFNAGCFESYFAFGTIEDAVKHADMRERIAFECPSDPGVASMMCVDAFIAEHEAKDVEQSKDGIESNGVGPEGLTVTFGDDFDSREKLEADVYRAADEMDRFYCGEKFIDTRKIIGWLERQAAITRAECDKPNWDYCETCELQAQLQASNQEREHWRNVCGKLIDKTHEMQSIYDEGLA